MAGEFELALMQSLLGRGEQVGKSYLQQRAEGRRLTAEEEAARRKRQATGVRAVLPTLAEVEPPFAREFERVHELTPGAIPVGRTRFGADIARKRTEFTMKYKGITSKQVDETTKNLLKMADKYLIGTPEREGILNTVMDRVDPTLRMTIADMRGAAKTAEYENVFDYIKAIIGWKKTPVAPKKPAIRTPGQQTLDEIFGE